MTLLAQEVWVARLCQGTIRHLDDLWWRIIVYLRVAEGTPFTWSAGLLSGGGMVGHVPGWVDKPSRAARPHHRYPGSRAHP
jgi:hypothetical protein